MPQFFVLELELEVELKHFFLHEDNLTQPGYNLFIYIISEYHEKWVYIFSSFLYTFGNRVVY